MKKNILVVLTCLLVVFCMTGCGKKADSSTDNGSIVKSKCSYYECLSKMSLGSTLDELNDVIGFEAVEGMTVSATTQQYNYDFGNDKKITVTISNGKASDIEIEYDEKELKNKKVTLDNLSDVKAKINDGVSYDEFKKAVGNVDGTLIEIDDWSNRYVWVAENGSSRVIASFDKKTNNLKFFNGLGFK